MPSPLEIAAIQRIVSDRKIPHLCHFTQVQNLPSILNNGIISQTLLSKMQFEAFITDPLRLDNKRDYSCLSIGFPTHRMFYRVRNNIGGNWIILLLDVRILWEHDCLFYPINAADHLVRYRNISEFQGSTALEKLYECTDAVLRENYLNYYPSLPSSEQAEVMVPGIIPPDCIHSIIFDSLDLAQNFEQNFPLHGKNLYYNPPNQRYFTTRKAFCLGF